MDFISWIPALTTTSLFGALIWLCREFISTRLTRSVQHEFDRKLAKVRADFQAAEEQLKSELREKEAAITALRGGALSTLASRQVAIDKRRLKAIDQLWCAFNSLAPARGITTSISFFKFDVTAKQAVHDDRLRSFFETIGSGFDQSKIDQESANKARIFISPMAWAIFSAYRAVAMYGVMQWHVIKGGLGNTDFGNHEVISKLIAAVLPHYADHLEKNGPSVYHHAFEALENKLIAELQSMLVNSELDKAALEQAAQLSKYAQELQTVTDNAQKTATA